MQKGRIAHVVDYHPSYEFEQHNETLHFSLVSNSISYLVFYVCQFLLRQSREGIER